MTKPNNPKGTTRDVNAAQRAQLALQLRAKKMSYQQIALECGYADKGACHHAVMRELDRAVVTNVDELRKEELESLERLEQVCWQRLQDKEYAKAMMFAVDRIIAIKERRARLMGLDVPVDKAMMSNVTVIREVPQGYMAAVEAQKV
jgi:hypothetical protein